jgi:hypothetical protein
VFEMKYFNWFEGIETMSRTHDMKERANRVSHVTRGEIKYEPFLPFLSISLQAQ